MADMTMKITAVWDFSALAASFRQAADALEALQASLTPEAPAAASHEEAATPSEDPQGP